MSNQNLLYFFCGAVAGGTLGVLGTVIFLKKRMMKELDRRVEEMESYYKRTDKYDKRKRPSNGKPRYNGESNKSNTGRENGALYSKDRDDICKATDCKDRTNYSKMFKNSKKGTVLTDERSAMMQDVSNVDFDEKTTTNYVVKDEELLAEGEYPEEDEDEFDGTEEEENEINEAYQRDRDRDPRIISFDKMAELDASYENRTLFFYMYDDTVVDEDDNIVDEPHLLLGDCLEKYGFVDNEEKLIFVQNFKLRTVYEVEKVWKSFDY